MTVWTDYAVQFLRDNYPSRGLAWCIESMGISSAAIRQKASRLGLKQDRSSPFFADWQRRAAASKVGRKRPAQAEVMKRLHSAGKLIKTLEQRLEMGRATKARIAANGHPRGALGLKHTPEAKQRIGENSRAAFAKFTDDQILARTKKNMATRAKNGTKWPERNHVSWKGGWREIGGKRIYFRSRWEANYARVLEWLKAKGEISEWEHEPTTFWFDGIKRGCVSYLPDFRVHVAGHIGDEYHEVKGWMDDRSKTKIRRMKKYHPDVILKVIDAKQYKVLEKQMSALVVGWE